MTVMAVSHLKKSDGPYQGILHGPSAGLRAWADWIIDVRRRWHEGDPPRRPRWRLVLGSSSALLAVAAIIERMISG